MRLVLLVVGVVWAANVYLCHAQEESQFDYYTCEEHDDDCFHRALSMQDNSTPSDDEEMFDEMFDEMNEEVEDTVDDHYVMDEANYEEDGDEHTAPTNNTQSIDSTSTPSPTGPPISHLSREAPQGDTDASTDAFTNITETNTDSPLPTGPPMFHLARQGPKRGVGRRPQKDPFPTPFRQPSVIGLIGFTVRRATVGRAPVTLSFKKVISNTGKGWKQGNYFMAPLKGGYYFSYHAVSTKKSGFKLALTVRGRPQVFAYASKGYKHGDCSAFLRLREGDRVALRLQQGAIHEPAGNKSYTTFTGIIVGVDLRRD